MLLWPLKVFIYRKKVLKIVNKFILAYIIINWFFNWNILNYLIFFYVKTRAMFVLSFLSALYFMFSLSLHDLSLSFIFPLIYTGGWVVDFLWFADLLKNLFIFLVDLHCVWWRVFFFLPPLRLMESIFFVTPV